METVELWSDVSAHSHSDLLQLQKRGEIAIMNDLFKKFYNSVLVYEKEVIKHSKVVDEEITQLMKPYEDKLNKEELDELYNLLCSVSLTAEQNGFELGVRLTIKMLVELLTSDYIADDVGIWSMYYADNYIKEDLGSDYFNLSNSLKPNDDRFLVSSYIAWSNIEAGYDANGKKEITTTIQKPITTTSFQAIDAKWNLWIQSGCDTMDGIPLEIDRMNTKILGINDLNVTSVEGAEHAMTVVEGALEKLSANRSKIGAQQNRLEHTIRNQENTVENTTTSESRIRDADIAELMVKYSKDNILEQAGHAMMAQANQSTSGILNLLQ